MDFLRHKMGILAVVAALLVLAAVAWFCLAGSGKQTMPEGTLVEYEIPRREKAA